jgi:F0F1-type ATP synthase epsilon subunit
MPDIFLQDCLEFWQDHEYQHYHAVGEGYTNQKPPPVTLSDLAVRKKEAADSERARQAAQAASEAALKAELEANKVEEDALKTRSP